MKIIQNKLTIFLFIALVLPHFGFAQDNPINELTFEVNRVYPSLSLTKEALKEAQTLVDLNKYYKPSWVREYLSVEILTRYKGEIKKVVSENNILTEEQKAIMDMADIGTNIEVRVEYIPENNLKQNDKKKFDFKFSVDPEKEAKYVGGQAALNKYLKEKAIDQIPDGSFINYDLTAIRFTINEEGKVIDTHIFGGEYQPSRNEKIDQLLVETISNMPCWTPAEYANGIKAKQEFALTVGNMENCVINLLNIRTIR